MEENGEESIRKGKKKKRKIGNKDKINKLFCLLFVLFYFFLISLFCTSGLTI